MVQVEVMAKEVSFCLNICNIKLQFNTGSGGGGSHGGHGSGSGHGSGGMALDNYSDVIINNFLN